MGSDEWISRLYISGLAILLSELMCFISISLVEGNIHFEFSCLGLLLISESGTIH